MHVDDRHKAATLVAAIAGIEDDPRFEYQGFEPVELVTALVGLRSASMVADTADHLRRYYGKELDLEPYAEAIPNGQAYLAAYRQEVAGLKSMAHAVRGPNPYGDESDKLRDVQTVIAHLANGD